MAKSPTLDHLKDIPLLSGFTKKELETIAKAGTEMNFTAGSTVIDQGQAGSEAFIVMSGSVTVTRNGNKIATLGPGSIIGEMSLLDHEPRVASATCDTDCDLLVIGQRHFTGALLENPTLALKLLATLAGRVRELDKAYYG